MRKMENPSFSVVSVSHVNLKTKTQHSLMSRCDVSRTLSSSTLLSRDRTLARIIPGREGCFAWRFSLARKPAFLSLLSWRLLRSCWSCDHIAVKPVVQGRLLRSSRSCDPDGQKSLSVVGNLNKSVLTKKYTSNSQVEREPASYV